MTWVAAAVASAAITGAAIDAHQKNKLRKHQEALANQIHPVDTTYKESPEIKQNLGLVQQLFNAQAPGASSKRDSIFTNQENTLDNIDNNATSGSQALALGSGVQGQTNQAINGLQGDEEQYHLNMLQSLFGASENVADQEQKVYMDQVRKFNADTAAKAALTGASIQNQMSANADVARMFSSSGQAFGNSSNGSWWNKKPDNTQQNNPWIYNSNQPQSGLTYIPRDEQMPG